MDSLKKIEIVLVAGVVLLFGCQLLNFSGEKELFALASWFLALFYLTCSFLLFKSLERKEHFFPIFAAIAFSTSLVTFPFAVSIARVKLYEMLPLLNVALFCSLCIFLLVNRKKKGVVSLNKGMLIRSLVILIVVGFFSYIPLNTSKAYRSIFKALNSENDHLVNNIQMFNYMAEFDKAIENGDCDGAMHNATEASKAGKAWLAAFQDDELDSLKLNQKIGGTFNNLYKANKCRASEYLDKGEYEQALNLYLLADRALKSYEHSYEYWTEEQAYSLSNIALCYSGLQNYVYADSFYTKAIDHYKSIKGPTDGGIAFFYRQQANSKSDRWQLENAISLHKAALSILEDDSRTDKSDSEIGENLMRLIVINWQKGDLDQALLYIEEALERFEKNTQYHCNAKFLYGCYYHRKSNYKSADVELTECLDCYDSFKSTDKYIEKVYLRLARVKIALAEYDLAEDCLEKGANLILQHDGKSSSNYVEYLTVYAFLNNVLANYQASEKAYQQALEICASSQVHKISSQLEVVSGLAAVENVLDKLDKAKAHIDSAMAIADESYDDTFITGILNIAGYINYCIGLYPVSDLLYRRVLTTNANAKQPLIDQTAIALNGLGLVAAAQENYKVADIQFTQSLKLHRMIFSESHPLTAIVYFNYAHQKISEGELEQAKEMLLKSSDINEQFFDKTHDVFANIYVAHGDISKLEEQPETAKKHYQQALEIYNEKFEPNHFKVVSTMEKLKNCISSQAFKSY